MGAITYSEKGALADYEFEVQAESLEELFALCGKATFEAMTDTSTVEALKSVSFEVGGETLEDLLFSYLAELIYLKDVERIFLKDFVVMIGNGYSLACTAYGEQISFDKHEIRTDVKAVTYHKLAVIKDDRGYSAHVILDV